VESAVKTGRERLPAALRRLIDRLWLVAGSVSVRVKILGIVLGMVLLLGGTVTWQVRVALEAALERELQSRAVSITRDVAARSVDLLLINDLFRTHQLLGDTLENNADVRYAFIVAPDGDVLAHTFEGGFPPGLIQANRAAPTERQRLQLLATEEGYIWDVAVPIFEGRAGTARVGLSEANLRRTLDSVTWQLLLTTGVVSLVGVGAAMLLTWLITRPILDLVQVTRAVAAGDLSQRAPHRADDEIGTLSLSFNAMVRDLAEARRASEAVQAALREKEAARGELLEQIIAAQEEERKRVARELHDGAGQALTSLMVGLKVLSGLRTPDEIQSQIGDLRGIAAETLEAVRDLALELRPSVLDDLGLAAAIARYAAECQRRFNLRVDSRCVGFDGRRLPSAVEAALYRIAQEALANVARHSGARQASVLLEWNDGAVRLLVEDNGCGFDTTAPARERKLGLYGMQERADLIGGRLHIESEPGVGTLVVVEVPAP
jgi:signal transduction histidine kinase